MNRHSSGFRNGFLSAMVVLFACGCVSTAVAQNADLAIVKSSNSSIVVAGTDVQYDLSVSNFSGEDSMPTNTLTDTLPAGMTFVSETHPDGWSCTTPAVGAAGTITCTYASPILNEQSFLFTFIFHLDSGVVKDTVISNTARISHAGTDPNSENNSSTATVTVGTPPPPPLAAHEVLISEFRLSGPGGASDEYVEFYCNRDADCDLTGMTIRSYDPSLQSDFTIGFPSNTIIPARQYLLIADLTQYSLPVYATPDFDIHDPEHPDFFVDNQGIQLIGADEPTIIDSVGFIGGGNAAQYIEGTGLQPSGGISPARPADQYAYVRKRELKTEGRPQDTNNNAEDFVLVSVTGTLHPGISTPPVLGAPGPQSLSSPLSYSTTEIVGSLVEPQADPHVTPNRVRTGSGNSGTLSIRRTFTNNTNQTFDYIGFRVVEIPTLNSPNPAGDKADLRLVTSGNAETFTNSETRTVVIRGTILEFDAGSGTEPEQPNGGGLNSSVHANLAQGEFITPGEKVDVQFLLNVVRAGAYRFFIYVEAFPSGSIPVGPSQLKTRATRNPAKALTPRRLVNLKRGPRVVDPLSKKPKTGSAFPVKRGPAQTQVWMPRLINVWATPNSRSAGTRRHRRKVVRRKSSLNLRQKAEARYGEKPALQN